MYIANKFRAFGRGYLCAHRVYFVCSESFALGACKSLCNSSDQSQSHRHLWAIRLNGQGVFNVYNQ
jgi:hypothetical protein